MTTATAAWSGYEDGILRRVGRQKLVFLLGFGLTLGAVAAAWSGLPRTWRATAAVIVASDDSLFVGQSAAEAQRLGDPADIESQMLLLRSPAMLGRIWEQPAVAAALVADCETTRQSGWISWLRGQMQEAKPCALLGSERQPGIERLEGGFTIGPTGRSRVLSVSYTAASPETAALVANALVDAYLSVDLSQKVVTREAAIEWLNSEILRTGEALRQAEMEVESYRRQHGLVRGQFAAISSERLTALSQQLVAAEAAQALAFSRSQRFTGNPASSREVLENRGITDLKQQLAQAAAQYAQVAQRFGDNHPDLRAFAGQRAMLQRQLEQETESIRTSVARDLNAANARVAELQRQYEEVKHEVGFTGGAEAGIATLVRNVEARREIFIDLSKRANTLETERRLLSGDARLVNHAELPSKVWFPKTLPFVAVGSVLATALGAGLALMRDSGDRRVRGGDALMAYAGVPVLGQIPRARRGLGRRLAPDKALEQKDLQDAVRALYGEFMLRRGEAPQVMLVASSSQGEGKTFTALALAHFAAGAGKRVLVVECDLRRPSFRTALHLPPRNGLSEYLRGEISLVEATASLRAGMLDVIVAGRPVMDSMELLAGKRMEALLQTARDRYDLIILDSPPARLLVDARLLARHADGVIYCARPGQSQVDAVVEGIQAMRQAGGSVVGVALGMVAPGERHRGYGGGSTHYLPAPEAKA